MEKYLPLDLENLILDYKTSIEHYDRYKYVIDTINNTYKDYESNTLDGKYINYELNIRDGSHKSFALIICTICHCVYSYDTFRKEEYKLDGHTGLTEINYDPCDKLNHHHNAAHSPHIADALATRPYGLVARRGNL